MVRCQPNECQPTILYEGKKYPASHFAQTIQIHDDGYIALSAWRSLFLIVPRPSSNQIQMFYDLLDMLRAVAVSILSDICECKHKNAYFDVCLYGYNNEKMGNEN